MRRPIVMPVLQVLGYGAGFALIWTGYSRSLLPGMPFWGLLVGIAAGLALALGIVMWTWIRVGGYASYWALWRWVHGGPEPTAVPRSRRLRYLKPLAEMGSGSAWFRIGLASFWLLIAVAEAFRSAGSAVGLIAVAAVWAVLGVSHLAFVRRWGSRAVRLYNETVRENEIDPALEQDPRVP